MEGADESTGLWRHYLDLNLPAAVIIIHELLRKNENKQKDAVVSPFLTPTTNSKNNKTQRLCCYYRPTYGLANDTYYISTSL